MLLDFQGDPIMSLAVCRWFAAAGAVLVLAAAVVAAPGPASGSDAKKGDSPAEVINKALDQVGDFALENTTLEQAINRIAEQGKINVVIDRFTITNQYGIDPNGVQVNVKLTGVKTRSALRSVLSQYSLGYAILGDTLLITNEEVAVQRQLRQRVSIDLDKTPAAQALKQLGKETGTNLIVDSRVAKESQTPVTLQIDDVPLDTAVRLIAEMSGLKAVRVGNVMFVTTKATAQELRQDEGGAPGGPGVPIPYEGRVLNPPPAVNVNGVPFQLVLPNFNNLNFGLTPVLTK
jgi:hypothetical protein